MVLYGEKQVFIRGKMIRKPVTLTHIIFNRNRLTMKQKCLRIAVFLMAVFLWSCSKDDYPNPTAEKAGITIKRMNFADLEANPLLLKNTEKFIGGHKAGQDLMTHRNLVSTGFGFSIDTDDFLYIGNPDKYSYTFKVYRDEETSYDDNLVLKKMPNGEYATFLIRYHLTPEDKKRLDAGLQIEGLNQKTEIAYFSPSANKFTTFIYLECVGTPIPGTYTYVEWLDESGQKHFTQQQLIRVDCELSITTLGGQDYLTYTFSSDGNSGGGGSTGSGGTPGGGGSSTGGNSGGSSSGGTGNNTGNGSNENDPDEDDNSDVLNDGSNPIITLPLMPLKKDCEMIRKGLTDYPFFKQALEALATPTFLTLDHEEAVYVTDASPDVFNESGTSTSPEVGLTIPTGAKVKLFGHDHIGNNTVSVFSPMDLIGIAKLIRLGSIDHKDFVAYVATNKGTYLAITISDPQKLLDLLYYQTFKNMIDAPDMMRALASRDKFLPLYEKYFDDQNPNALIKTTDTNNENVMKQFLKFLNEADAGVNIFESDPTFTNFTKLKLKNNGTIDRSQVCQ